MNQNIATGVAKALLYIIMSVTALVILFRGVVGPLWGSQSDLGLVGAVAAGLGGVYVLILLIPVMILDVLRNF